MKTGRYIRHYSNFEFFPAWYRIKRDKYVGLNNG
jgi:hypothetical protein